MNQLCLTSLFTKRERSLIFSGMKKSSFLKSMILLKFWNHGYSNILNLKVNKNSFFIHLLANFYIWFALRVNILRRIPTFYASAQLELELDQGLHHVWFSLTANFEAWPRFTDICLQLVIFCVKQNSPRSSVSDLKY